MRTDQGFMELLVTGAHSYWMLPGANGLSLSYCRKWIGPASTLNTAHCTRSCRQLKASCRTYLHQAHITWMHGKDVPLMPQNPPWQPMPVHHHGHVQ